MSTPPKGYYRQLLANDFPMVRIAFTHTPIYGCSMVDPNNVLRVLDSSQDQYAKFYSDGLRNGTLVTIVENGQEYVYKNNGELYFSIN
jgi:hypothetical protein